MPLYEYVCNYCGERFEVLNKDFSNEPCDCPVCGQSSPKVPSVFYDTFGWTLTEASHHEGNHDELISDRPSNEGKIRV